MKAPLRSTEPNAAWPSLWLVPAAVLIALALLATAATLSGPSQASSPSVTTSLPAASPDGAEWPVEHATVDWDKVPVEPDPSPRSVAAYGD